MKVGIYNSSLENSAGAGISAAILADALASKHQTEIIGHEHSFALEEPGALRGASIEHVTFRFVDEPPQVVTDPNQLDRRYQALRTWSRDLTRPYDLFINFADRLPVYCSAQRGVLVVQFPHDFVPSIYRALWLEHLGSYQLKLANSYYTKFWTRLFWEIDCPVVYPPLPIQPSRAPKQNLIVAAGSFNATRAHKQFELVSAFRQMRTNLAGWSLWIIGELDEERSSKRHFENLRDAASDADIEILANVSPERESELLSRAMIFWQAAGLGEDLNLQPQKAEPFDLSVLKAMAVGCVPVVANSGGLPEVVRHGENGFFYNRPDELIEHTLSIASDEGRQLQFSRAARRRAENFRPRKYTEAFLRQLESAFGIRHRSSANPIWLWKRFVNSAGQLLTSRR